MHVFNLFHSRSTGILGGIVKLCQRGEVCKTALPCKAPAAKLPHEKLCFVDSTRPYHWLHLVPHQPTHRSWGESQSLEQLLVSLYFGGSGKDKGKTCDTPAKVQSV